MNRIKPIDIRARKTPEQKGIQDIRDLPDPTFDALWDCIILDPALKDRLLAQAVLNFTARSQLQEAALPFHGIILLVGPPGTGKTSIARGLASRTAASLSSTLTYMEVEPHALASASLGKSQQGVCHLLGTVIGEEASAGPCIVLLDEVETLAADRRKMSLEANPVDVHRATDAVLAQLDQLAASNPQLLFVATSNFAGAIDEAFLSRADLIVSIDLPSAEACRRILFDTLNRIASVYPGVARLLTDSTVAMAAERAVGLDGRRIRKAVLAAMAYTKHIALNPESLTADAVLASVQLAQAERASVEGKR